MAIRCIRHAAQAVRPLAFIVAPCNMNEKLFAKPLLEKLKGLGVNFKAVLADAQYNSSKVREDVRRFGAESVIPYRRLL